VKVLSPVAPALASCLVLAAPAAAKKPRTMYGVIADAFLPQLRAAA